MGNVDCVHGRSMTRQAAGLDGALFKAKQCIRFFFPVTVSTMPVHITVAANVVGLLAHIMVRDGTCGLHLVRRCILHPAVLVAGCLPTVLCLGSASVSSVSLSTINTPMEHARLDLTYSSGQHLCVSPKSLTYEAPSPTSRVNPRPIPIPIPITSQWVLFFLALGIFTTRENGSARHDIV
jgi:hypothetical protein